MPASLLFFCNSCLFSKISREFGWQLITQIWFTSVQFSLQGFAIKSMLTPVPLDFERPCLSYYCWLTVKQHFTLKNSSFVLSFSHSQILIFFFLPDLEWGFRLKLLCLFCSREAFSTAFILSMLCHSLSSSPPVYCKMYVPVCETGTYFVYSLTSRLKKRSKHDILGFPFLF